MPMPLTRLAKPRRSATRDFDDWLRVGWQSSAHCRRCGLEDPGRLCSYGWCGSCNRKMTQALGRES